MLKNGNTNLNALKVFQQNIANNAYAYRKILKLGPQHIIIQIKPQTKNKTKSRLP